MKMVALPRTAPHRKQKVSPPPDNPDSTRCNYWVSKKQRFCRSLRRPGFSYCPTHVTDTAGDPTVPERVPCPHNPNHTVYAKDLNKHLLICPDLKHDTSKLESYSKDLHCNRGATQEILHDLGCFQGTRITHHDLSPADLTALLAKVESLYAELVAPVLVNDEEVAAPYCSESSAEVETAHGVFASRRTVKHTPQHVGILSQIASVNYLPQYFVSGAKPSSADCTHHLDGFVEFGAGRGGLALALHDVAAACMWPLQVCVVDRGRFRRKCDSCVSREEGKFLRVQIDLKDLNFDVVSKTMAQSCSGVQNAPVGNSAAPDTLSGVSSRHDGATLALGACGKHLCGACTDFTLSIVTAPSAAHQFQCIAIATCCHQLCEAVHMNKAPTASTSLVTDVLHMNAKEFSCIASLSSWAVCASVSPAQELLGWKCKRLIDFVRLKYLEACGFHTKLCKYVPSSVTKENVLLLAWR